MFPSRAFSSCASARASCSNLRASSPTTASVVPAMLLVAVSLLVAGCSDDLSVIVLEGRRYDQVHDCLGPDGVIDVVEGQAEGSCEGVRCFVFEGSGDRYVSAQCEAPDGYAESDPASDEVCEAALAAYARGEAGLCPDGA
jgi:hypothetical protein